MCAMVSALTITALIFTIILAKLFSKAVSEIINHNLITMSSRLKPVPHFTVQTFLIII